MTKKELEQKVNELETRIAKLEYRHLFKEHKEHTAGVELGKNTTTTWNPSYEKYN